MEQITWVYFFVSHRNRSVNSKFFLLWLQLPSYRTQIHLHQKYLHTSALVSLLFCFCLPELHQNLHHRDKDWRSSHDEHTETVVVQSRWVPVNGYFTHPFVCVRSLLCVCRKPLGTWCFCCNRAELIDGERAMCHI